MYKPSTYLVVAYFPTYLPMYAIYHYMRFISYRIGYQGEVKY
jgi:hypothetical protein